MDIRQAPAFRIAVLLIIGILCGYNLPASSLQYAEASVALGLVVLCILLSRKSDTSLFIALLGCVICVLTGVSQIVFDRQKNAQCPDSVLTGKCLAVGRIADPPTTVGTRTRWTLALEQISHDKTDLRSSESAAVTLVRTSKDSIPMHLEYGMRIALFGELSRPIDARNPGEFSTRRYYEANGITLTMFVRGERGVVILDSIGGFWLMRCCVVPARRFILYEIDRTVGGEEGEFLKGLVIGERSGMAMTTRQSFVNAGVAHVLAVSGSNVAVVAAVLILAFGLLRLPKLLSTVAVGVGVLFYMLLTGNQPSVARSTVMALVVLLGRVLQRKTNAYNALGVSADVILVIDARQLFDIGFQLSYGAVLSIVCLYPRLNFWISKITPDTGMHRMILWLLRLCAVSFAATLGTLPLTAISFGRVSVIGIVANLIVIPATSISVILGCISSAVAVIYPWASWVCAGTNVIILRWTLLITEAAGALPFAYLDTVTFRSIDALPFYAILALLLSFPNVSQTRRLLMVSLLAANIALFVPGPVPLVRSNGVLRFSMIDVGEGDALLLECPGGENILIDAGPATASSDAGEQIVVPFLKRRGISVIHYLLLSHPHSDHMGGASFILRHMDVRCVVETGQAEPTGLYAGYRAALTSSHAVLVLARSGETLPIASGIRAYVLAPDHRAVQFDSSGVQVNLNNSSLVFRVVYGSISFLLEGDAERGVEDAMRVRYGDFLKSTVLKVAHHGSSTSSTEAFIGLVRPELALISVGRNNMFRHPSRSVVSRYESQGVPLLRTDDEGAIVVETDGVSWSLVRWR